MAASGGYDVIVVGAGLGGLSAATFLAKAGRRVLVAEREQEPGGYARGFRRGPYTIDPALGAIAAGAEHELQDRILAYLGAAERCELVPLAEYYRVAFPGLDLTALFGPSQVVEAHVRLFPREETGIRAFFGLCSEVLEGAHRLGLQVSVGGLHAATERYPALFEYRTAALADVLAKFIGDPRARAVCGGCWPYLGLPPSRLSFSSYAQTWAAQGEGLLQCVGGFRRLVDALAAALSASGGELAFGRAVSRIGVEAGRVCGVELDGGTWIDAPVVVSAADAGSTFERLVGPEHLPERFVRRVRRMVPSLSAFVLVAATALDLRRLGAVHETFLFPGWDHEETFRRTLAGLPGGKWVTVPTLLDPSLAPDGEHLVVVKALAPRNVDPSWAGRAEEWAELLLAELDELYAGFRESLRLVECVRPDALERASGNSGGAAFGWENTVAQDGSRRLANRTPLAGLFLAGHWARPGTGAYRAILSGMHTARAVLAEAGEPGGIPEFRELGA